MLASEPSVHLSMDTALHGLIRWRAEGLPLFQCSPIPVEAVEMPPASAPQHGGESTALLGHVTGFPGLRLLRELRDPAEFVDPAALAGLASVSV